MQLDWRLPFLLGGFCVLSFTESHGTPRTSSTACALFNKTIKGEYEIAGTAPAKKRVLALSSAIAIPAGSDIQSFVDQAPEGSTFRLEAGIHRMQSVVPKSRQIFVGADGAVLNGSRLLDAFSQENGLYVASGQVQTGERNGSEMGSPGAMRAGYPDSVFLDDTPLRPVDALWKVTLGSFYFDYAADRIYLADDPKGRKVEAAVTRHAFSGTASNVTIEGLIIEKYANPAQYGTIASSYGWKIRNNEVRLNYGVGIALKGHSSSIGNYVHSNGQMGFDGEGAGVLIENNEIACNGWWSGLDVYWEGGGGKFAETTGLIVRGNYSHDNKGYGLWTDIDNINTLYEGNTLVNNSGGGISHEISYAATIRNNRFVGNGKRFQGDKAGSDGSGGIWLWRGAIQIQNSQNVEVYGNRIDMTDAGNGITLIQQERGSGAHGPYITINNRIHDNVIVSRSENGISGGAADWNEDALLNGGNIWSNNRYYMSDEGHWWWGDYGAEDSWSAYTHHTKQDSNSILSQDYPDTASWSVPTPALTEDKK
jgi:parallel beta-helix repeat protein